MIHQYWVKKWELERFMKYILKKGEIVEYGDNILTSSAIASSNISKQEFKNKFDSSHPPNTMLNAYEVWSILKKKYLD